MPIEIRRIGPFPSNRNGRIKFIEGLLEAGQDGFTIPKESFNTEAKMHFGARLQIFLHKEVGEVQEPQTPEDNDTEVDQEPQTPEDRAAELEQDIINTNKKFSKDDLLWFAEVKSIEIPEDVKVPLAIRKHIKSALESTDIDSKE